MKFMKLGSKPDAFQSDAGGHARFVSSDLPTDIVVLVEDVRFYLHKFPLLSKSSRLQRLVAEANDNNTDEIVMRDFPGGPAAFEVCTKFCYSMTVTLNAYNVVAARCAAEYLGMTEDVEKSNMIFKIEVFLNFSVLRSWKDSIIALRSTKDFLPYADELKIAARCIDSIATKASLDPENVSWSYTYSKKLEERGDIFNLQRVSQKVPKDWWVEDLCELDVEFYKRVIVAIEMKGRVSAELVGEALKAYAVKWLPDCTDDLIEDERTNRYQMLIETIVCLLPADKGSGCSCRFLLKLLKFVMLVGVEESLKEDLMNRISVQLHKASVKDLLIPSRAPSETIYDIDLVQSLISRFANQNEVAVDSTFEKSEGKVIEMKKESILRIGKIVDGYLAEVASDPNLSVSSFLELSNSVPDEARNTHDGLYAAINIFLKEHPSLTKAEKKKICRLMDVKKLTRDACIHAVQNEHLPLRVAVQILFFEQIQSSSSTPEVGVSQDCLKTETGEKDDWEIEVREHPSCIMDKVGSLRKIKDADNEEKQKGRSSISSQSTGLLSNSRSRRIFEKLWLMKGTEETSRSSELSGGSQSSHSSMKLAETKSSGSSSRNRRFSVS